MQIVLSHGYFLEEDSKEQKIMRPYPPLGLLYISAYLQSNGISNQVFDTTFASYQAWKNFLITNSPNVIGLYSNLMTKIRIVQMIKWIRKNLPHAKIVIGGPDTTYNIHRYLQSGAHFVVLGEGEITMFELSKALLKLETKDLQNIKGIAWLDANGTLCKSPGRSKIKDLDSLPVPNREGINLNLYLDSWRMHHGYASISVSTQRGCPYTCKWCSTAVYGQSYRRRSGKSVVNELKSLIDTYEVNRFWFVDDVFSISHKWLDTFEEELQRQSVTIQFECITRADRLNEDVIRQLKKMGCFRIWIGAESGSQKVIDLMDRRVNVQHVSEMIRSTRAHGVEAGTFIMLGYPGETEGDILQTVEYLRNSNPNHFTITIAYPINGTAMHREVVREERPQAQWEEETDREISFERAYSRNYYDHAVRYVVHAVECGKYTPWVHYRWWWHLSISFLARIGMQWEKTRLT